MVDYFSPSLANICAAVDGPTVVVSVWLAIIVRNWMLARGPEASPILPAAALIASSCAFVVTEAEWAAIVASA